MDRRAFLAGAGAALVVGGCAGPRAHEPWGVSALGVCTSLDKAELVHAAGGEYIEEGVRRFLVPQESEAAFEEKLALARRAPVPVLACNSFLPGSLRSVGPERDHDGILAYCEVAFARAQRAGVRTIVFGSSGSRARKETPEAEASAQFVELLKRMGPLAGRFDVTVCVEPLQPSEVDFVNTIPQGLAIVDAVDHPSVRLTADLFHVARSGEDPAGLPRDTSRVHHVHIAEVGERTLPGVAGDDFAQQIAWLRALDYRGPISLEGRWSDEQLAPAFAELRRQLDLAAGVA